jgi:hypothetical protein
MVEVYISKGIRFPDLYSILLIYVNTNLWIYLYEVPVPGP